MDSVKIADAMRSGLSAQLQQRLLAREKLAADLPHGRGFTGKVVAVGNALIRAVGKTSFAAPAGETAG
jgi:hypothetical protein